MKKTCTDCKTRFEVKLDDVEEGDNVNCPECNLEYTLIYDTKGKEKLVETKVLEMEDSEDEESEDSDSSYDSDSE